MSRRPCALATLALGLVAAPAAAQHGHAAPTGHGQAQPAAACTPRHAAMGHCTPAPATADAGHGRERVHGAGQPHRQMQHGDGHDAHGPADAAHARHRASTGCAPEHAAMGHCTPAPAATQAPREPIPVVTDADRAAAFPALSHGHGAHGPATYTRVGFNRFEAWDGDDARGQAWEGSASTGGDIHRLWLRSSGERSAGTTTRASAELQVSRAVARWWDLVAGVRHDFRPAASRTRAVIGVQGIAPYQFEVSALAYFGDGGGVTAKLEAEYDLRFSNRLVLQPLLELELHSQDDPARGTGSGVSKAEAGLRLRYEFSRRFAPYVGLVHERSFGATARHHQASGEASRDTRVVAGVRFWF